MDGDVVFGILMVLFWIVSSLAARFGKAKRPAQPGSGASEAKPAGAGSIQEALRDLVEQMGAEMTTGPPEAPVAGEHTLTGSEHQRTVLEAGSTLTEQMTTASEHRRTPSEVRRTASEAIFAASEHQLTASEHLRGDVRRARAAAGPPPAKVAGRSRLVRRLHADLTGGKDSLARAIVLREILGPPVGLRPAGQDRG